MCSLCADTCPDMLPVLRRRRQAFFKEEQLRDFWRWTTRELVTALPQGWCGVSRLLESLLVGWQAIASMYRLENKENPLEACRREVVELYSVVKPCTDLMTQLQLTAVPTGQAALLGLASLKLTTLNLDCDLEVLSPAPDSSRDGGAEGGHRPHAGLTPAGKAARERLREAVNRRWFDERYDSAPGEGSDLLFDVQMAVNPSTADLAYVDAVARSPDRAAQAKARITDKVVALAVRLAEKASAGDGAGAGEPPAKRKKDGLGMLADDGDGNADADAEAEADPGKDALARASRKGSRKADLAKADKLVRLGLLTKAPWASVPDRLTLGDQVRAELKELREMAPRGLAADLGSGGVLAWWKKWQCSFPLTARLARAVLGGPASVTVLERDLGDAGRMMAASRGGSDAGYGEMVLLLHGSLDLIPVRVPEVAPGQGGVESEVPARLRKPSPALAELDGRFLPDGIGSR